MLTLDLTYIGIQGYPNFNTFLGSMLISFQVGEWAGLCVPETVRTLVLVTGRPPRCW